MENTPDPDAIGRLLLQVEMVAHRRGWDEAPDLFVLYDARDHETDAAYRHVLASRRGPAIRCGPYAAQAAVPHSALDGNPAHALFRFALNVRSSDHPAVEYVIGTLQQPGFVGMAMLHEGWQRTMAPEEREALGNVRFADMPGSVEARYVTAHDSAGEDYLVQRERGSKPRLLRAGVDDFEAAGGAIIESLRVIVAKVLGRPVPEFENIPSQWDWERERANVIGGEAN